jgi:alpha-glucosidase
MQSAFPWWKEEVIYQIYPRSFADTNGDGLGDLPGIISRLDYLAHLGVGAIWLSPIYPSPDADFGYDVADHCAVDPRFGTLTDFDRLVREAHRRGIRIIMDLVLNHTSDRHPWFLDSQSSRQSPRRDWYIWRDPGQRGKPPNNWAASFGGSAWTFDSRTGQYYYHMFLPRQPDVNWRNTDVRRAQLDVVRFWQDREVDGFRLDVFNVYFKDAAFRANPRAPGLRAFDRQRHFHDANQPEMTPLLRELRGVLDRRESYSVGETFTTTPMRGGCYVGDDLLHAAFSFDFTGGPFRFPWRAGWLFSRIARREREFVGSRWPTTVFSNHDLPRAATRYSRGGTDEQAKLEMTLLLTLRGTPFLYYGEEIGMRDIRLRRAQIMDPPGRLYWPLYKGRDGCRGPMQWDDTASSGFSTSLPWLPVNRDYRSRNVARQAEDPDSIYTHTRVLIQLRKRHPALRSGALVLLSSSRGVLSFLRKTPEETLLVLLNFSGKKRVTALNPAQGAASGDPEDRGEGSAGRAWRRIFPAGDRLSPESTSRITLGAYETAVFREVPAGSPIPEG